MLPTNRWRVAVAYLLALSAIRCTGDPIMASSPMAAIVTSDPFSNYGRTATSDSAAESSESTRRPLASYTADGQKYMKINFVGSTEADAPTSTSVAADSVADTPPLTILEIENPLDQHILLGTSGPDRRESEAITRALDWLADKRSPDYGWANDTHLVILAKELVGQRDFADATDAHIQIIQDLEDMLSYKQMTIEVLSLIDHHHHAVIPRGYNIADLANYALALVALCKDPKHFMNQHDLLGMLQHHETSDDHNFALSTLAVCSSGEHVRKRHIRQLIDIALESNQNIETTALSILALRCIMHDHRNRHLEHFLRKASLRLALMQTTQGNIGTLRGTALTIQALQDLNVIPNAAWKQAAAAKWILDRQREDGSWSEQPLADGQDANMGIGLTAHIVLALGRRGLGAVRMLQCNHLLSETVSYQHDTAEPKLASPVALTPSVPSEPDIKIETVSFTYTIWFSIKPQALDTVSLAMTSPKNTTFYQAMVQASDIDPRFNFEAHDWPNGHYIHTIGGHTEDPVKYDYWLLYRLPEMPDPQNVPGNRFINSIGVDEIIVENNYHYLYWYKKL